MLLRVQGPDGQVNLDVDKGDTCETLIDRVKLSFGYNDCQLSTQRNFQVKIQKTAKTLAQLGLSHGDRLYTKPCSDVEMGDESSSNGTISKQEKTTETPARVKVIEDEVDKVLAKMDGKIPRDPSALCRHNAMSKCVHCIPLEPFDEGYLKEKKIKHLSFHSFLKKMSSGADKGKFAHLDNISVKIKANCSGHAPWPKGICSKCQPSALTLNMQNYRHVDCVMFENGLIVDRFLNYWRKTSFQRMGILIGRYEVHADVPLGIRAVVTAIYEPPQVCLRDAVEMLEDPQEKVVDEMCEKLGLRRVGWIFCDLLPLKDKPGSVHHLRSMEFSYLLSAQECITAGVYQNKYPNACKLASDGHFGSKFVTVCMTGDKDNQIHMEGYQVSNQCMALVRDNCLIPTQDAPELAWVRESSNEQYVPDVFYKAKDKYNNEVQKVARPLPVEYLLLDVPVSSPNEPMNTFRNDGPLFVVENRSTIQEFQDLGAVNQYLRNFTASKDLLGAARDFHFLLFLATLDVVHIPLDGLLGAVKNGDAAACGEWASKTEQWQTFETILSSMGSNDVDMNAPAGGAGVEDIPQWNCEHCTFTNVGKTNTCEMCSLPRT